jgi:hypothetical protein
LWWRLKLAPLVSHRIGLDDVTGAFDRLRTGTGARSPLVFTPWLALTGVVWMTSLGEEPA